MKTSETLLKLPGVYCITNIFNNKKYIGSSANLNKRFRTHFKELKRNNHYNQYFQNAWNKHGKDSFYFSVLEYTTEDLLTTREQVYLSIFYDEQKNCYNICPTAYSCKGRKTSDATKKKLSWLNSGERNPGYGKPKSEETKKRIREGTLGKKRTKAARKRMSIVAKNRTTNPMTGKFKTHNVVVLSPENKIFGPITNVRKFCEEHNLLYYGFSKLLNNKLKHHRGWILSH